MTLPATADERIATSEELRRAALDRSSRRNAEVASRRLRRRWLAFALTRLALFGLPALLAAGTGWSLWQYGQAWPPGWSAGHTGPAGSTVTMPPHPPARAEATSSPGAP